MRYTVEMYEKDNDVYHFLLSTDYYYQAKDLCIQIGELIKNELIFRECSDGHKEPFDWCQVYDNKNRRVVFCYGGIE